MHENRETWASTGRERTSPAGEGRSRTARMNGVEESDRSVVPLSQPNKAEPSAAEVGEGRGRTQENTWQSHTLSTQSEAGVSQGLQSVRQAARERKRERFTALLHHVNVDLLRESFYALKRQAAPGVDGVTWRKYETGLEDRLIDLHSQVHRGAYRAQPWRRVYIPKADGRQRPLGIASLEDKIVDPCGMSVPGESASERTLFTVSTVIELSPSFTKRIPRSSLVVSMDEIVPIQFAADSFGIIPRIALALSLRRVDFWNAFGACS